ncbi:zf-HC2 domain-containing protein [Desulfoscipio gibsoniae]
MDEHLNNPQCHDSSAWKAYQADRLSDMERLAMEEHLLTCESCLEIYLQILEEELQNEDVSGPGPDFTTEIMSRVADGHKKPQHSTLPISRTKLLVSYTLAAGIAMFFWVGGYFDKVSAGLEKGMAKSTQLVETRIEPLPGIIQTGWTFKILDNQQSSFLQKFFEEKEQIYEK